MVDSEESILRKADVWAMPGEGEILSLKVTSTVRLTADRRYEDNELLRIARSVVQFERHRSISRVFVDFVCPDCDKSELFFLVSETIASVWWEWAPEGGAFGKEVPNLGDYSEHSYRVVSNFTRD